MPDQSATVTLYIDNRLDHTRVVAVHALAREFIEAVRKGYFKEPCGGGIDWAYRLWLTAKDGASASWDAADEDVVIDALYDITHPSGELQTMLSHAVWGES